MGHNDTWFIGLKLLSVFGIGCIGSSLIYLPTFFKNVLNLSTDKVGFLYSITPFISCISFPYWTSYLDRTQAYKRTMIVNAALSILSMLFIAFVPLLTDEMGMTMILVSLGCFGFSWFGYPVVVAAVDSVTFLILGDYKELYGQQKTGCPIGFGSSVFLTGLTMEWFGPYALFGVYTCFALSFIATVALLDFTPHRKPILNDDDYSSHEPSLVQGNDTPSSYGSTNTITAINDDDDDDDDNDNEDDPKKPLPTIWSLLATPESSQFFLVVVMMGFATAIIQAFLFLFMRNDLHASPALVGLLGPLGSSTEIVCFFFSKRIFNHLGPRKMLMVAQWIMIVRCFIYVVAMGLDHYGAWVATAAQLLHGAGYSVTWSAAALQSDRLAPPHLKNSAQGLLNALFNGLGAGLGALCGGFIYNTLGPRTMWIFVIGLMLFSFVLYSSSWYRKLFLYFSPSTRLH